MNASTVRAASGLEMSWHKINWAKCHSQVRRLQARIVKATQEGRWNKVKALQWLLNPFVEWQSDRHKTSD